MTWAPTTPSAPDDWCHHDRLIASGLDVYLQHHDAPLADAPNRCACAFRAPMCSRCSTQCPAQGIVHLDPDTAMCPGSLRAALRAAGAGVHATDLVLSGGQQTRSAPSARPATTRNGRAMGFCFFNNIVVAARHALEAWNLERVAIIDFDVHHGNGTENIFAGDPRMLMVSIFQHPFYPLLRAENPLADNLCNVPLPARHRGDGSARWSARAGCRACDEFAPQMLFISAGFDAHYEDDMASLGLVEPTTPGSAAADAGRQEAQQGPHRVDAGRRLRAVGARRAACRTHPGAGELCKRQRRQGSRYKVRQNVDQLKSLNLPCYRLTHQAVGLAPALR
jgi:hypothetical protein